MIADAAALIADPVSLGDIELSALALEVLGDPRLPLLARAALLSADRTIRLLVVGVSGLVGATDRLGGLAEGLLREQQELCGINLLGASTELSSEQGVQAMLEAGLV